MGEARTPTLGTYKVRVRRRVVEEMIVEVAAASEKQARRRALTACRFADVYEDDGLELRADWNIHTPDDWSGVPVGRERIKSVERLAAATPGAANE